MTNHWADLKNAKVFLIEGSNVAENHVMAMKWIGEAKDKGAKVIHVDPRYNRTSGIADIFARIRPGADIAFLGALIRIVIEDGWYDAEYIKIHTNSLMLVRDDFAFADGSVASLRNNIDFTTWVALGGKSDGTVASRQ